MRPAAFAFSRPTSLAEALRALADGQSLLAAMRLRQSEPAHLVDLMRVAELDAGIVFSDKQVTIGALVTHRQLLNDPRVQAELPWLVEAAQALGDVQVRNLGTVLGNVCWADSRANMAVALLASDAVVTAVSPARPRSVERVPLAGFFSGLRRTALDGRLAIAIEVPRCAGACGHYLEFSRQRQDLALVNVCVVRARAAVRIAVGGIDPVPVRLESVEAETAAAVADGSAALIYPDWHTNLQIEHRFGHGEVDAAFAAADLVVDEAIVSHRFGAMPMETRVVRASFDPGDERLVVRASTQVPHQMRMYLSKVFGLPETRIPVLADDVGGGFGAKLSVDCEYLPVLASILLGRPVRWFESRSEWMHAGPACP